LPFLIREGFIRTGVIESWLSDRGAGRIVALVQATDELLRSLKQIVTVLQHFTWLFENVFRRFSLVRRSARHSLG